MDKFYFPLRMQLTKNFPTKTSQKKKPNLYPWMTKEILKERTIRDIFEKEIL